MFNLFLSNFHVLLYLLLLSLFRSRMSLLSYSHFHFTFFYLFAFLFTLHSWSRSCLHSLHLFSIPRVRRYFKNVLSPSLLYQCWSHSFSALLVLVCSSSHSLLKLSAFTVALRLLLLFPSLLHSCSLLISQ